MKRIKKIIRWALSPGRNSYKNKLRALLEGLETNHIDDLMARGTTGDFRNYGKVYMCAIRDKLKKAQTTCDE